MNILVTGGAGFIGSHVASTLSKHGHNVLVIDNFKTGKTSNLSGFRGHIEVCDITDFELVERKLSAFRPSVIHHLAAQSAISVSEENRQYDASVNIIGTLNLLKYAEGNGVINFIFSSTSAVYAPGAWWKLTEKSEVAPQTPYGISKLSAEHYIRTSGIPHAILRYGNVYGPKQVAIGENQVIARALSHFEKGSDFKVVGDGGQKRDFVYVEDIAYLHSFFTDTTSPCGTFNVSSGRSYSVNEVVGKIADLYGVGSYRWDHTKKNDPRGSIYIDNRLIKNETGMMFTDIDDGLEKTVKWWQSLHERKL